MKKTIYVVDDSVTNLTTAAEALSPHYAVMTIPSGERAVAVLQKRVPDLILLDIEMPEMDGFDVLHYIKHEEKLRNIPVIFLTAKTDYETEAKALEMGVVDFIAKPFNLPILLNRIKHHVDISNLVKERTKQLYKAKQDIIFVLADVVENRDENTSEHLSRTSRLVKVMLENMHKHKVYDEQISEWDFDVMAECSLLHDVGKIHTPDAILKKPEKLSAEEFEIMKYHTIAGKNIIEKIVNRSGENYFLHNAMLFAVYHHERWDGGGYPYGLKGEDIPIQGRIMGIVDVYDALISERAYKMALPDSKAIEIMCDERGKHFDPKIFDLFYSMKDRM